MRSTCNPFTPLGVFQSAPRSEERGDVSAENLQRGTTVSIRAPLRRAGRYPITTWEDESGNVSIRAPLRRAGRCTVGAWPQPGRVFQSAPRSEERGDALPVVGPENTVLFQSAPR